ncbi:unnamed protein product, partial [Prorocentrum cordatum]
DAAEGAQPEAFPGAACPPRSLPRRTWRPAGARMAPEVTTSARAYELARLLCDERALRVRKEKELNLRREKPPQAAGAEP